MSVHLVADTSRHARFEGSGARSIHIGLVNNMPDGALKATERQFLTLLGAAAGGVEVCLSLFALPEVPRDEPGLQHVSRFYSDIEKLWDSHLDGLIVTGADPQTANLADEPYWGSLTKVIDWAEHNTLSTVWSCLAAHAAILHNDGICRRRLSEKRFGVFECARTSDHPLTAGVPSLFRMPHSRWNDIPGDQLADCGYRVLSRAKDGSVDAFAKQRKNLAVFFQGHPEYDVNSLLLEYRRDVGRYLSGDRDTYPSMPEGYGDREIGDAFTELRDRALSDRRKELIEHFPTALVEKRIVNTWHSVAARLYGNWLAYLCAQKERLAVLT